jgi:hypothetical protein
MSDGENGDDGSSGPQFRAGPLITSAALVGAGTLIALAGLAVGSTHLLTTIRQWIREMETPPSELARLKWTQARAAMVAGAAAWQNGPSGQSASDSLSRRAAANSAQAGRIIRCHRRDANTRCAWTPAPACPGPRATLRTSGPARGRYVAARASDGEPDPRAGADADRPVRLTLR